MMEMMLLPRVERIFVGVCHVPLLVHLPLVFVPLLASGVIMMYFLATAIVESSHLSVHVCSLVWKCEAPCVVITATVPSHSSSQPFCTTVFPIL